MNEKYSNAMKRFFNKRYNMVLVTVFVQFAFIYQAMQAESNLKYHLNVERTTEQMTQNEETAIVNLKVQGITEPLTIEDAHPLFG